MSEHNGSSHHVTQEEKQRFLELLRQGHDPAAAAVMVNPNYRGSVFRRIANETSAYYDAEFSAEYVRARAEQRKQAARIVGQPARVKATARTKTMTGHLKADFLTDDMLEQFLEEVANGTPLSMAVEKLEPATSMNQITKRSERDPEFAEAFAAAKQRGYPHFVQGLRDQAIRQAFNGDYKALRDQLLIHDPEFRRVLLAQKHEISGTGGEAIRLLAEKALPELPREKIVELIEYMEQKQLGSGESEAA